MSNFIGEEVLRSNQPEALNRLFDFLEIQSVSTDIKHATDCVTAAEWVARELVDIGFTSKLVETECHPVVLAHGPIVTGAPTVLFYGHYDVQPAELDDGWEKPPFVPAIVQRDGRAVIHGRGTADDKGQVMTFIEACRALMDSGGMPVNVTMLIEGEEEIGSPSIDKVLESHAEELNADIALICDTSMLDKDTPAIGCQLRGFVGEIITIRGANQDLHSGNYGGVASNPAQIISNALASMRDESGGITLPGFYDTVPELAPELAQDWASLTHVGRDLLTGVGLSQPAGEKNRSDLEQVWSRPSFEINSLWSGYLGDGFKTVLPSTASAKISFRLVGDQVPADVRESFRAAFREKIPSDCEVSFEAYGTVPATRIDVSRPEIQIAKEATEGLWKNPCVLIGMGGSIPIVGALKASLNMDSLLLGFGLIDDNIHGENEKLDLDNFEKGSLVWLRFLEGLRLTASQTVDIEQRSAAPGVSMHTAIGIETYS